LNAHKEDNENNFKAEEKSTHIKDNKRYSIETGHGK
jgi:hypothetical protein